MLETSDLKAVINTTKKFIDLPIIIDSKFPFIAHHPFTNSTFSINSNGKLLNLENKTDYDEWKELLLSKILSAKSVDEVFLYVDNPYKFAFLKYTKQYLNQQDLSRILADCWIQVEQSNMDANLSKTQLTALFKQAKPEFLMDKEEQDVFYQLPNVVTVYRGLTSYNAKNIKALSWTLSIEVADWFAKRFGEEGKIYSALINKEHIFAYFNGRNEEEIILNPQHLLNINISN